MGGWHKESMKCEGLGRSILKKLKKKMQSTCVALMGFGEVTTWEESH